MLAVLIKPEIFNKPEVKDMFVTPHEVQVKYIKCIIVKVTNENIICSILQGLVEYLKNKLKKRPQNLLIFYFLLKL